VWSLGRSIRLLSLRAAALAFWLACVFVIAFGEAGNSGGGRANVPQGKPFESFQLPTQKPVYPALRQ
jgi:hypothetical protein